MADEKIIKCRRGMLVTPTTDEDNTDIRYKPIFLTVRESDIISPITFKKDGTPISSTKAQQDTLSLIMDEDAIASLQDGYFEGSSLMSEVMEKKTGTGISFISWCNGYKIKTTIESDGSVSTDIKIPLSTLSPLSEENPDILGNMFGESNIRNIDVPYVYDLETVTASSSVYTSSSDLPWITTVMASNVAVRSYIDKDTKIPIDPISSIDVVVAPIADPDDNMHNNAWLSNTFVNVHIHANLHKIPWRPQ